MEKKNPSVIKPNLTINRPHLKRSNLYLAITPILSIWGFRHIKPIADTIQWGALQSFEEKMIILKVMNIPKFINIIFKLSKMSFP